MAKQSITIDAGIKFLKSKTNKQACIYCGNPIEKDTFVMTLTNTSSHIVLKKNLHLHLDCIERFARKIKRVYKENKSELQLRSI